MISFYSIADTLYELIGNNEWSKGWGLVLQLFLGSLSTCTLCDMSIPFESAEIYVVEVVEAIIHFCFIVLYIVFNSNSYRIIVSCSDLNGDLK